MGEAKSVTRLAEMSSRRPDPVPNYPGLGTILLFGVIILLGIRAVSELAMMSVHGPDPQMPIWYLVLVVKLGLWSGIGLLAWLLIAGSKSRWRFVSGVILLLGWSIAICAASWGYVRGYRALDAASNPETSPERLRALVNFKGIQAGYELDNRLASHPKTPPDALRRLHDRPDQVGTELCLARNPNTPIDVLEELVRHEDEWVQKSLEQNPRLPESIRQQLRAKF
jgi:hypothetical protein